MNHTLDAPITSRDGDLFKRWPFAKQIADTISNRTDPSSIVVGIYGSWGDGKTTVLNFIQSELNNNSNIVVVRFNPWNFLDERQLLVSFFNIFTRALNKSLSSKKGKFAKYLTNYGRIAASLAKPLEIFEKIGKSISEDTLDECKDRVQKILEEGKKRVVILMDDIDRLDKSEISAVFKLVKLTADFDYTAYILAFDDQVVSVALQDKYPGDKNDAGERFLEKIVQVPLNLPYADEVTLRKLCFKCIDQVLKDLQFDFADEHAIEFSKQFIDGLQIRLTTPRMCKRYANALAFSLPILRGEVHPVDLMLIEGIRVLFPNLYVFIKNNPDIFLDSLLYAGDTSEIKKIIGNKIDGGLSKYNNDEKKCALNLLKKLFPKLKEKLENTHYGADWETRWNNEKRIASRNYFQRYFTCAILENDISDLVIDGLVNELDKKPLEESIKVFHELVKQENVEAVIMKLRYKEKLLSESASISMAKIIALSGTIFPNSEEFLFFATPRSQASILISALLGNITTVRFEVAKDILINAEPLDFAAECLRWIYNPKRENKKDNAFDESEGTVLYELFSKRIQSIAKDEIIYLKYGKMSPFMFWIWNNWGDPQEVKEYLMSSFEKNSQNLIEFLKVYLPTRYPESGNTEYGDLGRDHVDSIATILDLNEVYERLKVIYGESITEANDVMDYFREQVDKKVAFQFAAIFNQIEKEKGVGNPK